MTRLDLRSILAAGLLAASLPGCQGHAMDAADTAAALHFLGVDLPPNARDVKTHGEQGQDGLVLIRFEAPTGQVGAFVHRIVPGGLKRGADPHLASFGEDLDWWVKALPAGASGGESDDAAANRSYRVVAAPAKDGLTTVWLAAFSR